MPLDDRHAPLDSPNLTGEPTAPTPGIADNSSRIATTAFVKAQQRPPAGNQTITLHRDGSGSGTNHIAMEVAGLRGRPLTSDAPTDTAVYVWNEQTTTWELKRSEEIGALPGGSAGQVQVNDGTGQFDGVTISGDVRLDPATGIETVVGLQGNAVGAVAPTDLQVLTWNQAANRWQPGTGVGTGIGIPGGGIGTLQVNDGGGNFRGVTIAGDATINTSTGVETVRALQGRAVSATAPANGQVLTWVAGSAEWQPEDPAGGSVTLDSPIFTGDPTAPTASPGDADFSLANTEFVSIAIGAAVSGFAPIASPLFTGNPRGPTPSSGDPGTSLVTKDFVASAISGLSFAPLDSPIFTGDARLSANPIDADNDLSIASTHFVKAQGYLTGNQTITISNDIVGSGTTAITATLPNVNSGVGTFAVQTVNAKGLTTGARDLAGDITTSGFTATLATVNTSPGVPGIFQGLTINAKGLVTAATDAGYLAAATAATTYAPLANPILTGDPHAPTASPGDADFSIANTAFVAAAVSAGVTGLAPIASPTFTGDPKAPNPASPADDSTSIATTHFVKEQGYQTVNSTITLTGDVTGSGTASFATSVVALRGRAVSATAPADTQVLTWNTSNNQWEPAPPTGSSVTVAGSNTQVQFNNSAAFGGSAGLTLDTTKILSATFGLGSDATGDIYYRESTGLLARLAIGTAGTVLQVASGKPVWQAIGGSGAVLTGTGPQIAQYPTGPSSSVGGVTLSGDATILQGGQLVLATQVGLTPGAYQGLTVNAKGLVTAAVNAGYLTAALAATTYAPLASPTFTGTAIAPAPSNGNSTQIATTAFVTSALVPYAPLASPTFTGTAIAPAPSNGNSTQIATTAFVTASFLTIATAAATYAPLASPTFTGTAIAPAPSNGNSTQIATTAFVTSALLPKAPLASPVFTGDPQAPTPATNAVGSVSIATTAFVRNQNYLIANQTITVSGDISGSGTTAITLTLPNINSNVGVFAACTLNARGQVTAGVPLGGGGDVTTSGSVATLATSGVVAGTYHGIQYDAKGRAINAAPTSYVTTDVPSTNLTAVGTTRATGLTLTSRLNEVLTVAAGTGVVLPAFMSTPGETCEVIAYGANDLKVYPLSGQTFWDGGVSNGADQPLIILAGNVAKYRAVSATKLYRVSGT